MSQNAEIFCVGSLNIDHVYRVERIVCPGETIAARSCQVAGGGKGANQSLAAARAGARVRHLGCVGQDGLWLLDILRQSAVNTAAVRVVPETTTGHAIIQLAENGENAIVIFAGANAQLRLPEVQEFFSAAASNAWVLLQNEINLGGEVIEAAARCGLCVALNPAPYQDCVRSWPLQRLRLLALNRGEAAAILGHDFACPQEALGELRQDLPETELLLTLGADGAAYLGQEGYYYLPARKVEVRDTTAAGDTFIGYFIAARAAGRDALTALQQATTAAAFCVSVVGAMDSIPYYNKLKLD